MTMNHTQLSYYRGHPITVKDKLSEYSLFFSSNCCLGETVHPRNGRGREFAGAEGVDGEGSTVRVLKFSSTKEHDEPLEPDYSFKSKQLL